MRARTKALCASWALCARYRQRKMVREIQRGMILYWHLVSGLMRVVVVPTRREQANAMSCILIVLLGAGGCMPKQRVR